MKGKYIRAFVVFVVAFSVTFALLTVPEAVSAHGGGGTTCGEHAHKQDGHCVCDAGYEGNPIAGCTLIQEPTCGANAHVDGNHCDCNPGYTGNPIDGCEPIFDPNPGECKHEHAECNVNDSNKQCCPGLICSDKGVPSDIGKCEYLTPTPVDCQVSEWSECSAECGGGSRTRTILVEPQNGGAPCPPLVEECNTDPCPIDCQWGPWSECSAECGGGIQTRSIAVEAQYGGQECTGPSEQECNTQECKEVIDCVWSEWSECSAECGGGIQTRFILTPAQNGGKECTGSTEQECNTQECPILGCTDKNAVNYNKNATKDDGSCEYPKPVIYPTTGVDLVGRAKYSGIAAIGLSLVSFSIPMKKKNK